MEYNTLLLDKTNGICQITLNRPEALNAMSREMHHELSEVLDQIEADDSIRVVILTGAGRAFVAGADISCMADFTPEEARAFSKSAEQGLNAKMTASKKIFIAAINGFALGGGMELAIACDLLIASEYAKFGLPEVGLGILAGAGGTQRLPRLIGFQKAMELILTGTVIKAQEALDIGLVCKVTPAEELLDTAYDVAKKILKNATLAVAYTKACVQQSRELSLSAGLQYENTMFGLCFSTPDQKEGMSAFLEKRDPTFQSGF